jgi:hypothetical protein
MYVIPISCQFGESEIGERILFRRNGERYFGELKKWRNLISDFHPLFLISDVCQNYGSH